MTQKEFDRLYNETLNTINDYANQSSSFEYFLHRPSEATWDSAEEELRNLIGNDDEYVQFHSGASKAVIVSDDSDYVIKMPFLWEKCGKWNREKCDYDPIEWEELADYCKIEWRNFALAHEEGLDKCFAKTYYLGEFEGCPIYIQEKFECYEEEVSDAMWRSAWNSYKEVEGITGDEDDIAEIERNFSDNFYDEDYEYQLEDLTCEMWGKEIARKFWDFCETSAINDLHTGNLSCWEDTLVVVDYSGYGSNSEEAFRDDEWCRNVLVA